jgi:non-ribosomal peptide synthetase component F
MLQFSSPVFDVSVVDYFATLSTGATLCLMPRGELMTDMQAAVTALRPTAASLTPSVAKLIDPMAATLEVLILSGEVVPVETRDMYLGAGVVVINAYGPTEGNIV